MGWASCGTDDQGRPIGYGHEAICDHPGCEKEIDRGLGYACGGDHGGGEWMCDLYFCGEHLTYVQAPDGLVNGGLCPGCTASFEVQFPHCDTCGGWGFEMVQEPEYGGDGMEVIGEKIEQIPCKDCGEHGIYKSEVDWGNCDETMVVYSMHPDIGDAACGYCKAIKGNPCTLPGSRKELDPSMIHIERTAA